DFAKLVIRAVWQRGREIVFTGSDWKTPRQVLLEHLREIGIFTGPRGAERLDTVLNEYLLPLGIFTEVRPGELDPTAEGDPPGSVTATEGTLGALPPAPTVSAHGLLVFNLLSADEERLERLERTARGEPPLTGAERAARHRDRINPNRKRRARRAVTSRTSVTGVTQAPRPSVTPMGSPSVTGRDG